MPSRRISKRSWKHDLQEHRETFLNKTKTKAMKKIAGKRKRAHPGGGVASSPAVKRQKKCKPTKSVRREELFLRKEWDGDLSNISREINLKTRRVLVSIYCGRVLLAVFLGHRRKETEKDFELSFALVDKRVRGFGIGGMVVQLALALYFERAERVFLGAERLEIWNKQTRKWDYVDDEVSPVVNFWKRQGFAKVSLAEFGDEEAEVAPFRMTKKAYQSNPNTCHLFEMIEKIKKLLLKREVQERLPGVTNKIKIRLNAPWMGDFVVDASQDSL